MARQRKRGIKGAGSVYQRKSDGRWVGSFKVEETGKRKYVYAPVENNTQKAAYDLLQQALREQEQGRLSTGKDQKLEDYLQDWFENVHKPTIYISTYVGQRGRMHNHIIPALGQIELRKLTARHVQTFLADMGRKGLSAGYMKKIYDILHGALDNAVKWKLVPENVSDQVTLPTVQKRKKLILTKEQIIKLVEVANTHKMGTFVKLGLMTGLRHGEMLALRWSDLDLDTSVLSVTHNVADLPGYGFVEGNPKTDDGKREIILPQFVLDALKVHREQQQVLQREAGNTWKDKDLIFCTRTGGYVRQADSMRRFRNVLKEAGLPETMRVHDLRHNVATFLANVLKYPPQFIQALLGHSDVATTLGMYVEKVDPETLRPMMKELNRLFGGGAQTPSPHDLRRDVVAFLINAFHYPPDIARSLRSLDPAALEQMMNDLNDLLGGSAES